MPILKDRYEFEPNNRAGKGGFGSVYKAKDLRFDRWEIAVRDRLSKLEIEVKAIFNGGTNGALGTWPKLHYRGGEQVRQGMAIMLQCVFVHREERTLGKNKIPANT